MSTTPTSDAPTIKPGRPFLLTGEGWPYLLVPLIPVAIVLEFLHADAVAVFAASALGVVPTAALMGRATEELAARSGPGIGGLLNVTFGNAPELIIALFALGAGLHEVVKASLVGSILGNILLVLGVSMLVGGRKRDRQRFELRAATAQSLMLLLATVALVMPAIFQLVAGGGLPDSVVRMSRTDVAAASCTGALPSPSRCARNRTWSAASSPEMYATDCPASAIFAAACSSSVDLPIPGSPPISVAEPSTKPPPSARSSSAMPVTRRSGSTAGASSAVSSTIRPPPCRLCLAANGVTVAPASSTSVFHSAQSAHCPCHRDATEPQA